MAFPTRKKKNALKTAVPLFKLRLVEDWSAVHSLLEQGGKSKGYGQAWGRFSLPFVSLLRSQT